MLQKTLFIPRDLQLIEELVLEPTLEPRFNAISAYLVWDDELPSGITPDGLDVLSSLWTARALFHRGLTFSDHPVNPEYSRRVWEQALKEIPSWPGFQRLQLSEADQSYFEEMIGKENPY
ncbi:MAG: hypothetical protein Q8T09_10595 [Candidatus Melainabacteria bacterium]|nr:hypothetical protein [Candidatus Melainabacteria bacterium]